MIKNIFKCPMGVWRKFNEDEKKQYNQIRKLIGWVECYHVEIKMHDKRKEIIDVTAHNIACTLIWNMLGRNGNENICH